MSAYRNFAHNLVMVYATIVGMTRALRWAWKESREQTNRQA